MTIIIIFACCLCRRSPDEALISRKSEEITDSVLYESQVSYGFVSHVITYHTLQGLK